MDSVSWSVINLFRGTDPLVGMVFISFFYITQSQVRSSGAEVRQLPPEVGGFLKTYSVPASNAELLHVVHKSSRRPAVRSKQIFLVGGFFRSSWGTAFWELRSASDAKATWHRRTKGERGELRGAETGAFWALPVQHLYCSLFSTTKTVGRRGPDRRHTWTTACERECLKSESLTCSSVQSGFVRCVFRGGTRHFPTNPPME